MLMERAKSHAFWQQVRTDPASGEILSLIKAWYQASRWDEIPCLKYRPRMRFYGDGDRAEFERPYFRRRTYLSAAAFLSLIYPEEQAYLEEVQECLWAICCEYSWALPAHTDGTLEDDLHRIDLFSAETGFTLAEISYVLEDRLDKLVLDRARSEVRSRVIDNYINRRFGWESNTANWSAVCAGNVGGTTVSNADGTASGRADRAMISYLYNRFPGSVLPLPRAYTNYWKGNVTWMQVLRNLLYADHCADNTHFPLQDVHLPYAQQAVLHRKGYSLAAKAGHNHEPHNHNDVGSFILSTDQGQIFCDLGTGLYSRQNFDKSTRYGIFCNSSLSHSVPIVNGQSQRYGDGYNGTIAVNGNRITVDFPNAYGQENFRKLTRTVLCEDGLSR